MQANARSQQAAAQEEKLREKAALKEQLERYSPGAVFTLHAHDTWGLRQQPLHPQAAGPVLPQPVDTQAAGPMRTHAASPVRIQAPGPAVAQPADPAPTQAAALQGPAGWLCGFIAPPFHSRPLPAPVLRNLREPCRDAAACCVSVGQGGPCSQLIPNVCHAVPGLCSVHAAVPDMLSPGVSWQHQCDGMDDLLDNACHV